MVRDRPEHACRGSWLRARALGTHTDSRGGHFCVKPITAPGEQASRSEPSKRRDLSKSIACGAAWRQSRVLATFASPSPAASPAVAASPSPAAAAPQPTAVPRTGTDKDLILATTTSTQDSGLLDVPVPLFQQQTGYQVKTVSVGTGAALALGARGEADVVLVHAPAAKNSGWPQGNGTERLLVMHNDFMIVGPKTPPESKATPTR